MASRIAPIHSSHSSATTITSDSDRTLLVVVFVVVGLVGVDRTQEVAEHPLGDVPPLLSSLYVVKAEMDTLQDAHVHNITGDIRETSVITRLHRGGGVRRMQSEAHFVATEEER